MSGRTTVLSAFQNFDEILSWFEPRPDGVALLSERSHFCCTQFPYQGFTRPDQGDGRPNGWSDARNFHIWCSRHLDHEDWRPNVWILNAILALWMTASEQFQRSSQICVLERNPIACRTLSVIRTCCWNVRMDASWSSSNLLDTEEGPDKKFSSSGQMMLWTVGRPDGISRRPDGC